MITPKAGEQLCRLTGVGEGLREEAKEAVMQAEKFMAKYDEYMLKVTGETEQENVTVVDVAEVNRWSNIEAEGKKMANDRHFKWHKLYQGTALD